jgi:DNA-binding beta-propeller fold protein YncE
VVETGEAPMRASATNAPQFLALGRAHSLAITGPDGRQRRYGGVGRAQGKLNYPAGVAVANGLAYVVETGNHRVQIFDASGTSKGFIGESELLYPGAVAAAQNEILVADSRHARIVGFGLSGRVTRVLGAGILSAPRGLTMSGDNVLVADPGLRKVLVLGSGGRVQAELGSGWVLPWDVATDGKNAYVADVAKNEIGVVSLSGKRLASLPLNFAPANVAFRNGTIQATPQV